MIGCRRAILIRTGIIHTLIATTIGIRPLMATIGIHTLIATIGIHTLTATTRIRILIAIVGITTRTYTIITGGGKFNFFKNLFQISEMKLI